MTVIRPVFEFLKLETCSSMSDLKQIPPQLVHLPASNIYRYLMLKRNAQSLLNYYDELLSKEIDKVRKNLAKDRTNTVNTLLKKHSSDPVYRLEQFFITHRYPPDEKFPKTIKDWYLTRKKEGLDTTQMAYEILIYNRNLIRLIMNNNDEQARTVHKMRPMRLTFYKAYSIIVYLSTDFVIDRKILDAIQDDEYIHKLYKMVGLDIENTPEDRYACDDHL